MTDILGFAYAAIVVTGGVIGYVKAGSAVSLAMGALFGGISGLGAYQVSNDPSKFHVLMGSSAILGGVMGMRAYRSSFASPAGVIAVLSVLTVLRFVPKLMEGPSKAA